MLPKPGTSLCIPGYAFTGGFDKWEIDSTLVVLQNFFHAIIHDSLKVKLGRRFLDKTTCRQYVDEINEKAPIHNLVRVSSREPESRLFLPDVGDVSIRIEIDPDDRRREIALVRDSGMLITADRRNMALSKITKIPSHWRGFSAIIEVKTKGDGLLKQAESPRHDRISTDYISNEELRAIADARFRELGEWVYEEISKLAEPSSIADSENINELAKYLGIEGENHDETGEDELRGDESDPVVTQPVQSSRSPWRPKMRRGKKEPADVPGNGTSNNPPNVIDRPIKPKPKPRNRSVRAVPQSFVGVRFRKDKSNTHSVVVSFNQPEKTPTNIEMLAMGEDGRTYRMGIRKAIAGHEVLQVVDDNLFSLPEVETGHRQEITIYTREPVINKSFSIRFFEER